MNVLNLALETYCRYNQLLGILSSDPGVLQKLGEMYDSIGDKQQAFQFYNDVSVYFLFLFIKLSLIIYYNYQYFNLYLLTIYICTYYSHTDSILPILK